MSMRAALPVKVRATPAMLLEDSCDFLRRSLLSAVGQMSDHGYAKIPHPHPQRRQLLFGFPRVRRPGHIAWLKPLRAMRAYRGGHPIIDSVDPCMPATNSIRDQLTPRAMG